MKLNNSRSQFITEAGFAIDKNTPDKEIAIKILVGYHNYYMVGSIEAIEYVKQALKNAGLHKTYRPGYSHWSRNVPENAVCVGQFRVRSSDPINALYVMKK